MVDRTVIENMLEEHLKDSPLFLIDVLVKSGNVILVFIDSDNEVTISDCARISRFIETNLDRAREDYELRVSSAGIDHPYRFLRQYRKNQGRRVQVQMVDGTLVSGVLKQVNEQFIEIQLSRPGKRKKEQDEILHRIPMDQIKETKGIVAFG